MSSSTCSTACGSSKAAITLLLLAAAAAGHGVGTVWRWAAGRRTGCWRDTSCGAEPRPPARPRRRCRRCRARSRAAASRLCSCATPTPGERAGRGRAGCGGSSVVGGCGSSSRCVWAQPLCARTSFQSCFSVILCRSCRCPFCERVSSEHVLAMAHALVCIEKMLCTACSGLAPCSAAC